MSANLKIKNRKKGPIDCRVTLDAKHNEKLKYFKDQNKSLPLKKKKLENLTNNILSIKSKPYNELSDVEINKIMDMEEEIEKIEKEIHEIENNKEETQYLLDTGLILHQYYENINDIAKGKSKIVKKKTINKNNASVLDFFQKPQQNNNENNNENNKEDIDENDNENNEKSIYNLNEYVSREKLLDKYLSLTDKKYVPDLVVNDEEICKICGTEKTLYQSDGIMICNKCGRIDKVIIDSDKPSFKDPPREISYFAYKRINHFNEWLAQFQAKESTVIPEEVYNQILLEIKKERIENMAKLTQTKVRDILKKLRLNKYYEHVPHIINSLNGIQAPIMTRETEEKLRMMFKEIQTPFLKHCPRDRKNFLSYSYVLHKFVQLLDLDEYLVCFPLLKSREKLHQQDLIWEKICEELGWEFIKSI